MSTNNSAAEVLRLLELRKKLANRTKLTVITLILVRFAVSSIQSICSSLKLVHPAVNAHF